MKKKSEVLPRSDNNERWEVAFEARDPGIKGNYSCRVCRISVSDMAAATVA